MHLFQIFFIKAKKDVLDIKCLIFLEKKKSQEIHSTAFKVSDTFYLVLILQTCLELRKNSNIN